MPPYCSIGVTDGARTRDIQYHKLALYQLNYGHHVGRPVCHISAQLPRPEFETPGQAGACRNVKARSVFKIASAATTVVTTFPTNNSETRIA